MRYSRHAYTLIEQIVVMLIIGIMLSLIIGLSRYVNQRSHRSLAQAELAMWEVAISRFADRYGRVPTSNEVLSTSFTALLPPQFSYTDPWGNPYYYDVLPSHTYRIYSAGPDGRKETDDDIFPD